MEGAESFCSQGDAQHLVQHRELEMAGLGGRSTVGNGCPGMALGIYREIVALHRKIQRHLELVGADFSPLVAG